MPAKFSHLLRRNLRTEGRSWRSFLVELAIIVIIYGVIVVNPMTRFRNFALGANVKSTRIFDPEPIDNLNAFMRLRHLKRIPVRYDIAYAPKHAYVDALMHNVTAKLKMRRTIPFESHNNMNVLINFVTTLAGIALPEATAPDHLHMDIHFPSEFRTIKAKSIENQLWLTRCRGIVDPSEQTADEYIDEDLYMREGFLQLQNAIFVEWLSTLTSKGSESMPTIWARPYRHLQPTWASCALKGTTNYQAHMCSLAFLLTFLNLLWKFGREREGNLIVHHWKFGYSHGAYWCANFMVSLLRLLLLDVCVHVITLVPWSRDDIGASLLDIDPVYPMLYLLLHGIGMLLFAILLALLVSRPKTAVMIGVVIWLLFHVLIVVSLNNNSADLSRISVLVSFMLFFNNSISFSYVYMQRIDQMAKRWELAVLFAAQLAHIALLLLALCVARYLAPGRYLQRLRCNCVGSCGRRLQNRTHDRNRRPISILAEHTPSLHDYETAPASTAEEAMRLRNVCMAQGRGQGRLKNVSLCVFKGEITVLLGHHGAGKTTLISVMAGWRVPTSGFVNIAGQEQDIYENWPQARAAIDVLMPHNMLYDMLTVSETLTYYVRIKLLPVDSDEARVDVELARWMHLLKPIIALPERALVRRLNFEQQRLLCLCCVLAAGTAVVLLDEPTLHMRAEAMRYFWSILQHEKADRAIVLATFSVAEAEAVGDRIGLLSDGVLQAYGTPFFLKAKYGFGYQLIVLKRSGAIVEAITAVVERHIADAVLANEVGDQLVYKLPTTQRDLFQKLLLELEDESANLGIRRIHMLGSELDEVYMRVGDDAPGGQALLTAPRASVMPRLVAVRPRETAKRGQQFRALLSKRLHQQLSDVVPLAMIVVALVLIVFSRHLSKTLKVRAGRHDSAGLGFVAPSDTKVLDALRACRVVRIDSIHNGFAASRINAQSFSFTSESFSCEEASAQTYVDNPKRLPKYGLIEMGENVSTFWFNQRMFHSAPVALNLLHNFLARQRFPDRPGVAVTVSNDPLQLPLRRRINLMDQVLAHLRMVVVVGVALPVMAATFAYALARERINHMLFVQIMAGLRLHVYWLVNLFWDWLIFSGFTLIFILIIAMVNIEGFGIYAKLSSLWLIVVYGLPALTLTYLVTMFHFQTPLHALLTAIVVHLLTGPWAYIIYWDVLENNKYFYCVASFLPGFAMLDGLSNIYTTGLEAQYCDTLCGAMDNCKPAQICDMLAQCCLVTSAKAYFSYRDPGVLGTMTFLMGTFLLLWLIIFFIMLARSERLYALPKDYSQLRSITHPYDDDDVIAMKQRLGEADMREYRKKRYVVDQLEPWPIPKRDQELPTISFDLASHDCLAILGTRHSGKTHLLQQLAGERRFAFGDIFVMAAELKYDRTAAHTYMGYWPQVEDGFEYFTVHQLMQFICKLRGYDDESAADAMQELTLALNMHQYVRLSISRLDTERRQKMGIALALIADNAIVLLDEPTRGMSAPVRREIWNVLRVARQQGRAIIFTSGDAGECAALADRILIYDEGEMWAIGSALYLRNKFTVGFYLEIELNRDDEERDAAEADANFHKDIENLHRFVAFLHEQSEMRSRVDNRLLFYVPVVDVLYSYLYGTLEKNRRRLNIANYTVSQGTIEDVVRNISASRLHRSNKLRFVAFQL